MVGVEGSYGTQLVRYLAVPHQRRAGVEQAHETAVVGIGHIDIRAVGAVAMTNRDRHRAGKVADAAAELTQRMDKLRVLTGQLVETYLVLTGRRGRRTACRRPNMRRRKVD